ncbi:DUF1844 domain-containing protein [bacterium]|nr:DUF1844 domain-containing protein [bacterium]
MESEQNKYDALFYQLIVVFQTAALQQMGRMMNPSSEKAELNLEQARFSIDILDMLRTKTIGNLNEKEEKFLDDVVSGLQLTLISEENKKNQ